MAKRYIVWNADRTEGFVTDLKEDAIHAHTGKRPRGRPHSSSLALNFHEYYGEDMPLPPIDEIEISDNVQEN